MKDAFVLVYRASNELAVEEKFLSHTYAEEKAETRFGDKWGGIVEVKRVPDFDVKDKGEMLMALESCGIVHYLDNH